MEKTKTEPIECRLMVIGAGMAGMAAALFAARRGIATVQAGLTGETLYASGLFDLYGVSPGTRMLIDDPWQGLKRLRQDHPRHPFGLVSDHQIRSAMDLLTRFLDEAGHPYRGYPDQNARVITPVGTIKRTFRVPATMWAGVTALETKAPCLIVDVKGLRGFSAKQIVSTLKPSWPDLTAASIDLPRENRMGPKYAEHIARGLEVEAGRRELAEAIAPHLGQAKAVGLPAILAIHGTETVRKALGQMLGVPVFEIPTMPPAISGIRLKEAFDAHMPALGVNTFYQHTVHAISRLKDGRFVLEIGRTEPETTVVAEHVLLATGRFLGKGLVAGRQGIGESLFDLPVSQPENRGCWHRETFLDPRGHAINLAGVETDDRFRPVTADGRPVYDNLYAAGSILAHQDWIRTKSGTGLAVATAYGAIEAMDSFHP
ncbi:MAG: glycerol-3-phosphate dehydrogenase subunit GlpB [Desulfobacterales bacterium]|nr:glycerol-3-phosphate dehydrogenase subunit GlpB [Desulfobacterales bacterium]